MRIKELVIEGFKSYPVRTVIDGWDPSFNAITGLNGSGKSNILDAIAFVLGITNMSVMRASNQQDLIYKRGQAGTTKASVTIIFDNENKDEAPLGFDGKEIIVTRQVALPNVSRYLVNGRKSDQKTVHNFFQLVGLNINNPNFVIMQGRITKVLSMKPQEILGMVEEAAGTRMFEDKRANANRIMAKKEKRVNEIQTLIEEDITPKLNRLRKEKQAYVQYQKGENECDALSKKLHALEWTWSQERAKKRAAEVVQRKEELRGAKEAHESAKRQIKDAEGRTAELVAKREKELQKGGKIDKLKAECSRLELEVQRSTEQVKNLNSTLEEEQEAIAQKEQQMAELEESLLQKQKEVEELHRSVDDFKKDHDAKQLHLEGDEALLQSLQTGLTKGNDQNGGGYLGQITAANSRISQAQTEAETTKTMLGMKQAEMQDLERKAKDEMKSAGEGKKRLNLLQKELQALETSLAKCGWDSGKEQKLNEQVNALRNKARQAASERDRIKYSVSSLDFDFQGPPDFDRNQVLGPVGRWIQLDEKNYDKAAALEIAAGGRLFQVIIENERAGKILLTPKLTRLSKRTTFIPLNKVDNKTQEGRARQVANATEGKATIALRLVGYPPKVYNAMAYVFGSTFICDDVAAARTAAFECKVRAVTVQGDLYDPSGTLTGGSASKGSGILVRVQEVLDAERKLVEAEEELAQLESQGQKMKGQRESFSDLQRKVEMKKHELQLAQGTAEGGSANRAQTNLASAQEAVRNLKEDLRTAETRCREAKVEVEKLKRDMAEFKDNKGGKIDELKESISKQKSRLQKSSVTLKTQQKALQTASLEKEQMEAAIKKANGQMKELSAESSVLQKNIQQLQEVTDALQATFAVAHEKLDKEQATVSKFDDALKKLDKIIRDERAHLGQLDADILKLDTAIAELKKEHDGAVATIKRLEEEFDWILRDKDSFGEAGGEYDFTGQDPQKLTEQISELEKHLKQLKKKVNTKAAHMINDVEKREEELQRNLNTVLEDKRKIEESVDRVNRSKRETVEATFKKVSQDFGDIFRELLPGNFAKLQIPDGMDLMDGLEVKVQLGEVWKQSLTELSGGQKSLIALSLIMALLQYKPAPMYILDEIDAALDLSHTQHIGTLFRTRFKGSQFIVVSLKEGLFANANVLFRARFREGTSTVERIERTGTRR